MDDFVPLKSLAQLAGLKQRRIAIRLIGTYDYGWTPLSTRMW